MSLSLACFAPFLSSEEEKVAALTAKDTYQFPYQPVWLKNTPSNIDKAGTERILRNTYNFKVVTDLSPTYLEGKEKGSSGLAIITDLIFETVQRSGQDKVDFALTWLKDDRCSFRGTAMKKVDAKKPTVINAFTLLANKDLDTILKGFRSRYKTKNHESCLAVLFGYKYNLDWISCESIFSNPDTRDEIMDRFLSSPNIATHIAPFLIEALKLYDFKNLNLRGSYNFRHNRYIFSKHTELALLLAPIIDKYYFEEDFEAVVSSSLKDLSFIVTQDYIELLKKYLPTIISNLPSTSARDLSQIIKIKDFRFIPEIINEVRDRIITRTDSHIMFSSLQYVITGSPDLLDFFIEQGIFTKDILVSNIMSSNGTSAEYQTQDWYKELCETGIFEMLSVRELYILSCSRIFFLKTLINDALSAYKTNDRYKLFLDRLQIATVKKIMDIPISFANYKSDQLGLHTLEEKLEFMNSFGM